MAERLSLPEFNLDTDFMAGLRSALIRGSERYPEGRNQFIDLTNINPTKPVAKDEEDAQLAIRISSRTITPTLTVLHPITKNTDRKTLTKAKVPVSKPWTNQAKWQQILESEKVAVRNDNEQMELGEVKDKNAMKVHSKTPMNQLYEFYKSREAFQCLKDKSKQQVCYIIESRFLSYISGRFTFGEMPGSSISYDEAEQWLTDLKNGTGKFKRVEKGLNGKGKVTIVTYKPSRVMALQARRVVNRLFNVLDGPRLNRNPIAKTEKIKPPKPRTSKLNREQVNQIWNAADTLKPFERDYVRFLMLTAQRFDQAASLEWSWVDWENNRITFPASCMKGQVDKTSDFIMPMCDPVRDLLEQRRKTSVGHLVFGTAALTKKGTLTHDAKITNSSRLSARIDAGLMGEPYNWSSKRRVSPFPWTFHDFRRTASMLMQEADSTIRPYHTKLLIAHKLTQGNDAVSAYWNSENEMEIEKIKVFELLCSEVMKCVKMGSAPV